MLLSTTGVPRLTRLTIHRTRLERWLGAYAQSPVRLLVAPSGSGKTSVLLKYAAESETQTAYCALPAECTAQQLHEILAAALGLPRAPKSYSAMVEAVSGSPARCVELIVDEADSASHEAIEELLRLVEDVADNISLIYAARSRERLNAHRLIARGLAALCDARTLAFQAQEAVQFAEACGAQCSDLDANRLIDETDGWAMAVSGALRVAAAESESPLRAYERWRWQSSAFLDEFVAAELERVSDEDRRLFDDMLNGAAKPDRSQLRHLEACGLMIYDDGAETLRPYRVLRPHAPRTSPMAERPFTPPMIVRMFRSFEAQIDGHEIPWIRRRDQQIVKYLLLKPDGKATRAELASVFWCDTDRHQATQSVRTACSTIRKAFAAVVGYAAVDTYFRTTPEVQIDVNAVVCDVRRFTAHVNDAEAAYDRGDKESAAMHYRAADKLYVGRLLEQEGPEPWCMPNARVLQERYALLLERLADAALEAAEYPAAQQYALRAHALTPEQPGVIRLFERLREVHQATVAAARPEQRAERQRALESVS